MGVKPGAELLAIALRVHHAYEGGPVSPVWNDVRALAKEVIEMANPDDDDEKVLARVLAAFAELAESKHALAVARDASLVAQEAATNAITAHRDAIDRFESAQKAMDNLATRTRVEP